MDRIASPSQGRSARADQRPARARESKGGPTRSDQHGESDQQGTRDQAGVQRLVSRLSDRLGQVDFDRYFAHQTRFALGERTVDVTVASQFRAAFLERRFGGTLRELAGEFDAGSDGGQHGTAGTLGVRFLVDRDGFPAGPDREDEVAAENRSAALATSPTPPGGGTGMLRGPRPRRLTPGVLRHRLEDFVVGDCNRLAYNAALRLADHADAGRFSPLFVHGSCGLGKTHLLQGIVERFVRTHSGANVRYTTAESFTNEFISAMRAGNSESFRRSYRRVDLLCLDDVHFFSSKEATQEELLHTFDALDLDGSRVVLASDEHPREIRRLSEQLTSRFLSGAVVRLDPPDPATRLRLVRQLAVRRGLPLEDPAAQLIADRTMRSVGALGGFGGSVREIEGVLTQVEAVYRLLPEFASPDGSVGLNLVRKALGLSEAESPRGSGPARAARPIQVTQIAAEVCRTLRVDVGEMMGKGRHQRVVLARSLTAYLSRRLTTMSFPEIARAMARPNHSTVITACKRIADVIGKDHPIAASQELGPDLAGMTLGEVCDRIARRLETRPDGE